MSIIIDFMRGASVSKLTIKAEKKYLVLPVGKYVDSRKLVLVHDGKTAVDIDLRLDYVNPSEYVCLDISKYRGDELTVEVLQDVIPEDIQSDAPPVNYSSSRNFRPQVHFTPDYGWINDPNGLLEYTSPVTGKKTYHMFYQYNPYDTVWGNMHWGHAVSSDLIRWEHRPIALFPDGFGTMFSGSAVIDRENRSGLKEGEEDVILLFYTAAGGSNLLSEGKKFTQCLAYSTDGGETFRKYADNPIVPHIAGENRDPKVIWCEEMQRYVMALYLEDSLFQLLVSDDLLHWEKLQDIVIEGEAECPDIYPLYADGDKNNRKWIISGASHRYVVCEYRNYRFNIIQNARPLNYGRYSYAAQTFSGVSDGRRINIAWNRELTFPGAPFNGQMSIPTEMSLVTHRSEYFLCANPVKELTALYGTQTVCKNIEISKGSPITVPVNRRAYRFDVEFSPADKNRIVIDIFGKSVKIEPGMNLVRVGETTFPLSATGVPEKLVMIADTCSIELISGKGEAIMTAPLLCDYNLNKMLITADERTFIKSLTVTELIPR